MKGIIKKFIEDRGYGFIEAENGNEIFVHKNNMEKEVAIKEGDKVEFDIEQNEKGPSALNVKLIK